MLRKTLWHCGTCPATAPLLAILATAVLWHFVALPVPIPRVFAPLLAETQFLSATKVCGTLRRHPAAPVRASRRPAKKSQKISCIADALCRIMSRLFGAARFRQSAARFFCKVVVAPWSWVHRGLATRSDIGDHGNDSPKPWPRSGLRLFLPVRAADAPGLHEV